MQEKPGTDYFVVNGAVFPRFGSDDPKL